MNHYTATITFQTGETLIKEAIFSNTFTMVMDVVTDALADDKYSDLNIKTITVTRIR